MPDVDVFVSVGGTATAAQEAFVRAVEDRLRAEGIAPHTVGRNTFSSDAPLRTVTELLGRCSGAVVIAFERKYFAQGIEKRGAPGESVLSDIRLPTPWNQIEAAMAYANGLPLMVIVESGLHCEGLLEPTNEWYVQRVPLNSSALSTAEFNGILSSWKQKMQAGKAGAKAKSTADLTIGDLLKGMKPSQLWGVLAALAALIVGAVALGQKLAG
jgi:hypothetical protein